MIEGVPGDGVIDNYRNTYLKERKEEYSLSILQIERLTSINKRYRFKSIELSITPSPDSKG